MSRGSVPGGPAVAVAVQPSRRPSRGPSTAPACTCAVELAVQRVLPPTSAARAPTAEPAPGRGASPQRNKYAHNAVAMPACLISEPSCADAKNAKGVCHCIANLQGARHSCTLELVLHEGMLSCCTRRSAIHFGDAWPAVA
eukprot:1390426-Pleurochrysis_carterae.AAC.3